MNDSQPSPGLTFHSGQRLKTSKDFQRVFDARLIFRAPGLTVYRTPNGGTLSRLGVSVGKKHGNAVERNRLKRIFREAFRLTRSELPAGLDFVFVPRDGAGKLGTQAVREALGKLALQLAGASVDKKSGGKA